MSRQNGSASGECIDQRDRDTLPISRSEVISYLAQNEKIEIFLRYSLRQRGTINFNLRLRRTAHLGLRARRGRKIDCIPFVAGGGQTLGEHADGATRLKGATVTSMSNRADDRIVPLQFVGVA